MRRLRTIGSKSKHVLGALGLGVVTLCNHSGHPCARVDRNYAQQTLDLIATAPIRPGDEITIDYRCTLWFEPVE